MFHKLRIGITLFIFFASIIFSPLVQAQPSGSSDTQKKTRFKIEPDFEYLTPSHRHRDIQTLSFNFWCGAEFFRETPLTVSGGITSTYAWGTITQWDDNFNDVIHNNKAFGIGPAFLLRFEPFVYRGFSLAPEFSGGVILYTSRFPYGGDIYNFMWRMGGSVNYRISKKYVLNLNTKWMHISNGQSLGPQNPSYEAWGFGVGFARYF